MLSGFLSGSLMGCPSGSGGSTGLETTLSFPLADGFRHWRTRSPCSCWMRPAGSWAASGLCFHCVARASHCAAIRRTPVTRSSSSICWHRIVVLLACTERPRQDQVAYQCAPTFSRDVCSEQALSTDPLTGLANRRCGQETLRLAVFRTLWPRRFQRSCSAMLISASSRSTICSGHDVGRQGCSGGIASGFCRYQHARD